MAFRFDMQGKTSQQQIIVAKRDSENKRLQQEAAKREAEKKIPDDVNINIRILAIDKDTCPTQDNIIMKEQCVAVNIIRSFLYNSNIRNSKKEG
ncbi:MULTISPECIES: hypothetical protein [unclassified Sedimentibacter]|uniref:hypothetical protein n=1 Tax=unclassified Sedimentibacter TaxID=2649220 RepID=UPI0027E04FD1|nr:hypothetical protein [Sedimentibacter sp. MB35-C1]WMJ77323.1 hypothetical protein RBQ61_17430 [Sedimentibacter sp. MB35-C1]